MSLQKVLDEGTAEVNEPDEFCGSWDQNHIWVRRVSDENWYIQVKTPDGCYAYDGYWPTERRMEVKDAVDEAFKGAMLLWGCGMIELGEACSHGIKWACHCSECDLISARELVSHWGPAVDEARRVIAEATGQNVMLKVDGKSFRCKCGCNVFHRLAGERDDYGCNACELQYEGN